jgi:hypothetical protein
VGGDGLGELFGGHPVASATGEGGEPGGGTGLAGRSGAVGAAMLGRRRDGCRERVAPGVKVGLKGRFKGLEGGFGHRHRAGHPDGAAGRIGEKGAQTGARRPRARYAFGAASGLAGLPSGLSPGGVIV